MTASAVGLPFQEQIDLLRDKVLVKTDAWTDIRKGEHTHAAVVAGANRDDVLTGLYTAIRKVAEAGGTIGDLRRDFDEVVAKTGWSYKGGRNWRTRVIYDTNLRTSYHAGRYAQMTDPDVRAYRPYWRYRHGDSAHPRPLHLSWNGTILVWNDPWWNTHYCPNGWGCSCWVEPLSARDLSRLGKAGPDQAPDDGTYSWTSKDGTWTEEAIPNGIDPGWNYNVGKAAHGQPVAQEAMEAWKASGEQRWKKLTAGDWRSSGRPAEVPADHVSTPLGDRVETTKALTESLRKVIGGAQAVYRVPGIGDVMVDAVALGAHLDPKRGQFLPLLPELLTNPFEVWMGFEQDQVTGKMALRKYVIRGFDLGHDTFAVMVAQAVRGVFEAWTLIPTSRASYIQNRRAGTLMFGR